MIAFRVYGNPVPKQSFRYVKGGGYTSPRVTAWQSTVTLSAVQAMRGADPLEGELSVSLVFFLPDKRRRDLDNLSKAVLDAMNRVVYTDDQQITALRIIKLFGADPGVDVEVKGIVSDSRGIVATEYLGEGTA